jgi:hypothetical protein
MGENIRIKRELARWTSRKTGAWFLVEQTGTSTRGEGYGIWNDPSPSDPQSKVTDVWKWTFMDEALAAWDFLTCNDATREQVIAYPSEPVDIDGFFRARERAIARQQQQSRRVSARRRA